MKTTTTQIIVALIICFFSFQTAKAATGDISGDVVETGTNAPVAFAQVILDNGTTQTTISANEYGHFSAKHLPTGKYEVVVKYDNHTVSTTKVRIQDSYTLGVNFAITNPAEPGNTVETEKIRKDNTEGALRQHSTTNYYDMLVNPTQGPVKRPLA